jgi:hypothetical protein
MLGDLRSVATIRPAGEWRARLVPVSLWRLVFSRTGTRQKLETSVRARWDQLNPEKNSVLLGLTSPRRAFQKTSSIYATAGAGQNGSSTRPPNPSFAALGIKKPPRINPRRRIQRGIKIFPAKHRLCKKNTGTWSQNTCGVAHFLAHQPTSEEDNSDEIRSRKRRPLCLIKS